MRWINSKLWPVIWCFQIVEEEQPPLTDIIPSDSKQQCQITLAIAQSYTMRQSKTIKPTLNLVKILINTLIIVLWRWGIFSRASTVVSARKARRAQAARAHVAKCDNRDHAFRSRSERSMSYVQMFWCALAEGTCCVEQCCFFLKLSIAPLVTNATAQPVIRRREASQGRHGGGFCLSNSPSSKALSDWDNGSCKVKYFNMKGRQRNMNSVILLAVLIFFLYCTQGGAAGN